MNNSRYQLFYVRSLTSWASRLCSIESLVVALIWTRPWGLDTLAGIICPYVHALLTLDNLVILLLEIDYVISSFDNADANSSSVCQSDSPRIKPWRFVKHVWPFPTIEIKWSSTYFDIIISSTMSWTQQKRSCHHTTCHWLDHALFDKLVKVVLGNHILLYICIMPFSLTFNFD